MSDIKNDLPYFVQNGSSDRVCVPMFERIKDLYTQGFGTVDMVSIINDELGDILGSPLTASSLNHIIANNKKQLHAHREGIAKRFGESIEGDLLEKFRIVSAIERQMVSVYSRKITALMEELDELDPSEQDDGMFKNTNRIFIILELIKKFHDMASKITGTEAIRDVEIFRMKEEIKASGKENGGLLPSNPGTKSDSGSVDVMGTFI